MEEVIDKLEVTHVTTTLTVRFKVPPRTWIKVAPQGNEEFFMEVTVEGSDAADARGRMTRLRAALTEALNE